MYLIYLSILYQSYIAKKLQHVLKSHIIKNADVPPHTVILARVVATSRRSHLECSQSSGQYGSMFVGCIT